MATNNNPVIAAWRDVQGQLHVYRASLNVEGMSEVCASLCRDNRGDLAARLRIEWLAFTVRLV